jgi:2-iminobutanoate/2-iminopropanoate deaminase
MARQPIFSDEVLRPTSPYSSAVKAGGFVFVAGMVPFTREGRIAAGDFAAQMRPTMENVRAVLEAAGSSLAQVVKVTVILARGSDFVQIEGKLPNPDFLVEVDCIAEA